MRWGNLPGKSRCGAGPDWGKWRQWGETALWCSQTVLFDAVRTSESLLCCRILTNHILPYFGAKKAECRRLGNIFQNDRKLRAHRAYRETTQRLRRMKWLRMWAVPTHALSSHGRAAVKRHRANFALLLHSKKARPAFRSGRAENQGCKKPFPKISLELATIRKAWGSIFFR